ncbi:GDP-fucose O-fucosyltransferase 1, partial [Brachionus plicatilis]
MKILALLFSTLVSFANTKEIQIDPKGYIVFCPCMGRFGNQMDQFLGALAFAKGIGRTLVLPHFVEYPERFSSSLQIPFQNYFKAEPLAEYTKVILMDDFMKIVAPKIWPKGNRTVFCYMARGNSNDCAAKDGNPFGPYWDYFGVDFDKSEFYGPLSFDPLFEKHRLEWTNKFPADKYTVLAFTGAPGAFPVAETNVPLQKYVKWSDKIDSISEEFIKK